MYLLMPVLSLLQSAGELEMAETDLKTDPFPNL